MMCCLTQRDIREPTVIRSVLHSTAWRQPPLCCSAAHRLLQHAALTQHSLNLSPTDAVNPTLHPAPKFPKLQSPQDNTSIHEHASCFHALSGTPAGEVHCETCQSCRQHRLHTMGWCECMSTTHPQTRGASLKPRLQFRAVQLHQNTRP